MARAIYRVAQINAYIKNIFENDYALRQISVRGEVSNCKYHTSGHLYFTLKDESSRLKCVMWSGSRARGLRFALQDGQQVVASGSIMAYEKEGTYQLYAREIVPDGTGDLHRRFEETKKRLEEMGMFAPEYKKPIPRFARRVGIVTASTGAAIRDIVTVAGRRNPAVELILCPAIVQGDQAAASIVRGIRTLDELGVDVIIAGRGGGSIEDLWAFNEEIVARAIFDCETPVISAVGHETDFTIADFAADLRAPTPSAAAELAVFSAADFLEGLRRDSARLDRAMKLGLEKNRRQLTQLSARLERQSPSYRLDAGRVRLANLERALSECFLAKKNDAKNRLALASARLDGVSPLRRLSGGYSYVKGPDGAAVKSVRDVSPGDTLDIIVRDGSLRTEVREISEEAPLFPREESWKKTEN